MVDGGGFVAQPGYEQLDYCGFCVEIRPDDGDILGVVLALEDFVAGALERFEERIRALVAFLYVLKDGRCNAFAGGCDLEGVGHKVAFWIEIDISAGVVGDSYQ